MDTLKITRHTTNGEIERFLKNHPRLCAKTVRAQALHERRVKRIEYKQALQEMEDGNYDIGKSNARQNEYWQRVEGHPPPEQQDQ